jgi:hypothetical protein
MGANTQSEIIIGGTQCSRYNSRIVRSLRILLLALCLAPGCCAQSGEGDAVQEFAARIVALAGPGAATLTITNSSSADAEQVSRFRRALQGRLNDAGVRLRQSAQATTEIRVTVTENARGLVYLAEVQQGSETRLAIVESLRVAPITAGASAMSLRRSLLAVRGEPVLDAAMLRAGNETKLVLLTAQSVVLYRQQGGKWSEESSAPIAHGSAFPLDLRGRLVSTGEHNLDAYLPGTVCSVSANGALRADCHDADDAWPMGAQAAFFYAGRNYFSGLLRPGFGKQMPPFFSAAALPYPGYTLWIFAGVDGQLRTHDGLREGTLNVHDWGSDLAAIRSGCGSGTQLLVTSTADIGTNDSLRGYEVVERQAQLAMPVLDFAGTITALWPAADGAAATVVVNNTRTGNYEVFDVSISCAQ